MHLAHYERHGNVRHEAWFALSASELDVWEDMEAALASGASFPPMWMGRVFVTHGTSNGNVKRYLDALIADLVICCYPAQVREHHPVMNVFGTWRGITYITIVRDPIHYAPYLHVRGERGVHTKAKIRKIPHAKIHKNPR